MFTEIIDNIMPGRNRKLDQEQEERFYTFNHPRPIWTEIYGPKFMKWWKGLQPSWRAQGDGFLGCNVPRGENWPLLRKGGTAGIYTVVIGLSWWIKAQAMQRDADSWIIVNDLTWVIQQMYVTGSSSSARPKRDREEDGDVALRRSTRR
jgi:hypothetical protein